MNNFIKYTLIISVAASTAIYAAEVTQEHTGMRERIQQHRADKGTVRERMGERRETRQTRREDRRENIKGQVQKYRSGRAGDMKQLCQQDPMNPACMEQPLE